MFSKPRWMTWLSKRMAAKNKLVDAFSTTERCLFFFNGVNLFLGYSLWFGCHHDGHFSGRWDLLWYVVKACWQTRRKCFICVGRDLQKTWIGIRPTQNRDTAKSACQVDRLFEVQYAKARRETDSILVHDGKGLDSGWQTGRRTSFKPPNHLIRSSRLILATQISKSQISCSTTWTKIVITSEVKWMHLVIARL